VVGGPVGRQLFDGAHHQRGGRVSGIRESQQVADQRRVQAARDQEHARGANQAEEQLQAADAGPVLGPGEQAVPRFGSGAQRGVNVVQGGQHVRGHYVR